MSLRLHAYKINYIGFIAFCTYLTGPEPAAQFLSDMAIIYNNISECSIVLLCSYKPIAHMLIRSSVLFSHLC